MTDGSDSLEPSKPVPAPKAARVAVLYTSTPTVVDDIGRAMHMAGLAAALDSDAATVLKPSGASQHWYPGSSTTPWQLDGAIRALREAGFADLVVAQHSTLTADSHSSASRSKHRNVQLRHGLPGLHLTDQHSPRVRYVPTTEMLVLDRVFPDGLEVPQALIGRNIVHLPTLRTDPVTVIGGAMQASRGSLLDPRRLVPRTDVDRALVDLLALEKELHPGQIAVMDGTFAAEGAGKHSMRPHVKNVVLASSDKVALDSVAARIMGFDPMAIEYIRLAHERGLGIGHPRDIEVLGLDITNINFGFNEDAETFASRVQRKVSQSPLRLIEKPILRSPMVPLGGRVAGAFDTLIWHPAVGRPRARATRRTEWGRLFDSY